MWPQAECSLCHELVDEVTHTLRPILLRPGGPYTIVTRFCPQCDRLQALPEPSH